MSLLVEQSRIDNLISRKTYTGISLDDLNTMGTQLDGDVRYLQDKFEQIEEAIERLNDV